MNYEMIFVEDYANGIEAELSEIFLMAQQNEIIFDIVDGRLRVATLGGELVSAGRSNAAEGNTNSVPTSLGKAILLSSVTAMAELASLSVDDNSDTLDVEYDDGMSDKVYRDEYGMEYRRNFIDGKLRNVFGQEHD